MHSIREKFSAKIRFITLKEFKSYIGFTDNRTVRRYYKNYLFAVGKPANCLLSNLDIFKIDDHEIK